MDDLVFDLVNSVLMVVFLGMCCLFVVTNQWKLAAFRFERTVMGLTTLAMGPLWSLLADAIPLDPPYLAPMKTYLQIGIAVLMVQMLFWSAFLRLRKHRAEEQAVLAANPG